MVRIVEENQANSLINFDSKKLRAAAKKIFNDKSSYEDEVDWDDFDSPSQIDIPTILWCLYDLEDGEDYQQGNGEEVMPTDPSNSVWNKVRRDLE